MNNKQNLKGANAKKKNLGSQMEFQFIKKNI